MIETQTRYFCDSCGVELLPYSSLIGDKLPPTQPIRIVFFKDVIELKGIYCDKCCKLIVNKGVLLSSYLLKSDVDDAIKENKVIM
jgi:hypothetical protein